MFGVDSSELLLIVLVAVVVIGPKDLPRVMRSLGRWVGKARGMAGQFRSGVDQMMRDSEIAELEQKWRAQNEAIMRAYPGAGAAPAETDKPDSDWGLPPAPALPEGLPPPLANSARPAPTPPTTAGPAAAASHRPAPGAPPLGSPAPPAAEPAGPIPPSLIKPAPPQPRGERGEERP